MSVRVAVYKGWHIAYGLSVSMDYFPAFSRRRFIIFLQRYLFLLK